MRKRCKRHIVKHESPKLSTQPWRINAALDPLRMLLDAIETTGNVDATRQGIPIFKDLCEARWYELVPAMEGVVEFFELAAQRHKRPLDVSAIRRIAKKLETMCPITAADIYAARICVSALHLYALSMTVAEASDLTRTVQINEMMQRTGVTASHNTNERTSA